MAASELYGGVSFEADLQGRRTALRRFNVDLPYKATETLLGAGGSYVGLPNPGQLHPSGYGIVRRRYVIRELGPANTEVGVEYATTNSGGRFAVPDTSGGKWLAGMSFEFESVKIPFCVRERKTITSPGGNTTKDVWSVDADDLSETWLVHRAEWEIPPPDFGTLRLFSRQNNKLHLIDGYQYLFRVSSITPLDNNSFRVLASWASDPGTRYQPSPDPAKALMPGQGGFTVTPAPGNGDDGLPLCRSPYHKLKVLASSNPETTPPTLIQIQDYAADDDGYKSLPGIPQL